jgi:hypothetical protein
MCPRQVSSSSFADEFEHARRKLDELGVQEPGEDEVLSPALSSSSSATAESAPSSPDTESPLSPATPITAPITPAADPDVADNFAFAFDIDGVLIRGGKVIPEAVEAMKVLNGENEWGIKV